MVRFPGENHELSRSGRPWHRIERLQHIVGWFDKYLLGKEAPMYDSPLNKTSAPTQTPAAQRPSNARPQQDPAVAARTGILRGEYGRYRANNDLISYHLDIRVDPATKFLGGKNSIHFKMLSDDTRIQIDLYANLNVDKILFDAKTPLKYERELNSVFIDFPETLKKGREYTIDFYYSGSPRETGRFGGIAFRKDPAGRDWINTACEGEGSSIWWPSKDQWRDEVDHMQISVAVPNALMNVSNGRFKGKTDLGDGYTRWDWSIHYPINSYNVSLNIGTYEHFADKLGDLTLDYYVLPENLEKAKRQFAQAKPMIEIFEKYIGEYAFKKDGFKLIEVPYSGMEHQSAVTYGNRFANGYLERDWTGVGISPKFDFIIIHESGHEWFGNAISAADVSDMWIHEGWTTYMETVYVEGMWGKDEGIKYTNGYKTKVANKQPIITERGVHRSPSQDQVLQGHALSQHAAQRHRRRQEVVETAAGLLQGVQVQEHHDRGRRPILQQGNGEEPDATLRSVLTSRRAADAGAVVRRSRQDSVVSVESGREGLRDADPRRRGWLVADDPADDRVEEDADDADARAVRGRDRLLLRQRLKAVGGRIRDEVNRRKSAADVPPSAKRLPHVRLLLRTLDLHVVLDVLDAVGALGNFNRAALFRRRVDVSGQGDDAARGIDVDLQAAHVRIRQHLRLHGSGDTGVAQGIAGRRGGVTRAIHRAGRRCGRRRDRQRVDDVTHAFSRPCDFDGSGLRRFGVDFAFQCDHSALGIDVDLVGLHRIIRGELALHRGRDAGIRLRARDGRCGQRNSSQPSDESLLRHQTPSFWRRFIPVPQEVHCVYQQTAGIGAREEEVALSSCGK